MASGYQLLSLPTEVATGEVTHDALRLLFAVYGEPLVIKSDNGGASSLVACRGVRYNRGV